jgi:hypothetical protein
VALAGGFLAGGALGFGGTAILTFSAGALTTGAFLGGDTLEIGGMESFATGDLGGGFAFWTGSDLTDAVTAGGVGNGCVIAFGLDASLCCLACDGNK